MDGHDSANAQEEPFDLSQRLASLSGNDLKVDHILMMTKKVTLFNLPRFLLLIIVILLHDDEVGKLMMTIIR